jgi:hypothetical protein
MMEYASACLGAEVTSPLVRAHLGHNDNSSTAALATAHLSRCAALMRFLNVVSALAERQLSLSSFGDAAAALAIPTWMVSVRHAVSHGALPGHTETEDAVALALRWTLRNYWIPEAERQRTLEEGVASSLVSSEASALTSSRTSTSSLSAWAHIRLRRLLELYGYLKLYSVWGLGQVKELKSDEEVYDHVRELWTLLWPEDRPTSVDSRQLDESAGRALAEVLEWLSRAANDAFGHFDRESSLAWTLREALVKDELLLPRKEVAESLEKAAEEGGLPKELLKTWCDVLAAVAARTRAMPDVLMGLFDVAAGGGDQHEVNLAEAWLKEICSRVEHVDQGNGSKSTKKKSKRALKLKGPIKELIHPVPLIYAHALAEDRRYQEFVDYCLDRPCEATLGLLPSLQQVDGLRLTSSKVNQLSELIKVFLGKTTGESSAESSVIGAVEDLLERPKSRFARVDTAIALAPNGLLYGQSPEQVFHDLEEALEVDSADYASDDVVLDVDADRSQWNEAATLDWPQLLAVKRSAQKSNIAAVGPEKETMTAKVPIFYRNPMEATNKPNSDNIRPEVTAAAEEATPTIMAATPTEEAPPAEEVRAISATRKTRHSMSHDGLDKRRKKRRKMK